MNIILVIANLCAVSAGGMDIKIKDIEESQLVCQKYYVNCIKTFSDSELKRCIVDKK